ncbi:MAG TPA: non-lysosomal glucosylceramidase [Candidatus Limnocylindrales bacterium]
MTRETTLPPAIEWPRIPAVAWRRGIGLPYEPAPRPRVSTQLVDDGPWAGVPVGGMGAGSIGRTYRGDFRRWHLTIGEHRVDERPLDGFSLFVGRGRATAAVGLSTLEAPARPALGVGQGTYHALFPRAWFEHDLPDLGIRLVEEQLSPVIPGDYESSALPVGIFTFTLENVGPDPARVGLMFGWQDDLARERGVAGPGRHDRCATAGATGVRMTAPAAPDGQPASLAIAAGTSGDVAVTTASGRPLIAADGIWHDFASDGALDGDAGASDGVGEPELAAVAATVEVPPGERRQLVFALAWDLPYGLFGPGVRFARRHTLRYGTAGEAAFDIAGDALAERDGWRAAIEAWQRPILEDSRRPDWYKAALFNELYLLVDGGTIWTADGPADGADGTGRGHGANDVGRFALLESVDYRYYNTLDVDFYASFALLRLWPQLELSVARAFVPTVALDDRQPVRIVASGARSVRKVAGAVPHDLGGPDEAPFERPNRYDFQDVNVWKDLNPKLVLRLWRDAVASGDTDVVRDAWPAIRQAMAFIEAMDRDGDGLPEHDGIPDQTYDTWPMSGPSAYGGSLWLAALTAASRIGSACGDLDAADRFARLAQRAKERFEALLWRGDRYAFDATSDTVMADQLVGQWYADASGLGDLLDRARVETALRTIHRLNVRSFAGGSMGPVNGMLPDGRVDTSSEQSQEVWTGTAYALAAFMIGRGLADEGWETARGVADVTYRRGLWFRTPEAYDERGDFRASIYLRPLAIWAIEEALERVGATDRG